MKLNMYVVVDRVTDVSSQILLARNDKEINRILGQQLYNSNDLYTEDYKIYQIGEYDNETLEGKFGCPTRPRLLDDSFLSEIEKLKEKRKNG